MIGLKDILYYYPPKLHNFPRGIIREYLQYLILQTIFSSKYSDKLCFIGGTSLRIGYNSQRFSEDLDFDNWGLTQKEFEEITKNIKDRLSAEGFEISIKHVYKGAFHCVIKLPKILYKEGLSHMESENLTIKIDTVSQGFKYEKQKKLIQNFGLVFPINIASESVLLSMKLNAFFSRAKGRDLFDIVFLIGRKIKPDFDILKQSLNISDSKELLEKIIEKNKTLNLPQLQKDVNPFLFDSNDNSVKYFAEIVENI